MKLTNTFQLQTIRNECFNEHALISHRIGWTLTIEAFLFTTFAISLGNGALKQYWWFTFIVVPVIGLVVAYFANLAIDAALETIKFWHDKEERFFENCQEFKVISRKGRPDHIHYVSMKFPKGVPNILIIVWITLSIVGLLQSWLKILPPLP